MNGEETVTISKKEYEELTNSSIFLSALEAAGIDSWDGYDDAKEIMEEWQKN